VRCVLLCMPEAVEGVLYLLEVQLHLVNANTHHPARVDASRGDVGHVVHRQVPEVRVSCRRRLIPRDA